MIRILALIFIYLLTADWLNKIGILPAPFGAKHLVLLLFFFLYSLQNKVKFDKIYLFLFALILLYSFLNFQILEYSYLNYTVGLVFTFLGFFTFLVSSSIKLNDSKIYLLLKLLVYFNLFASFISIGQSLLSLQYLRYSPGIFRESGAFADSMVFAFLSSLFIYYKTSRKRFLYFAIFFSIVVLSTTLKKSILSVLAILSLIPIIFGSKIKLRNIIYSLVPISIFLPAIIANINKNLLYFNAVGAEGHVRIAMYITSFKIMKNNFPFGCGLGQFGSFGSILGDFKWPLSITYNFSDVYYEYGIANLAGNSELRASNGGLTHLDTFWPHIFGELGVLGSIIFLIIWFYPILRIKRIKDSLPEKLFISGSILSMTIIGTGLIQPEVPLFIYYNFLVVGIIYNSIQSKRTL